MFILLSWVVLFATVGAVFYYQIRKAICLPALFVLLLAYRYFDLVNIVVWSLIFLVFVLVAAFVWLSPLRQKYFTRYFMTWFKAQQPPISESEKVVLEAGGTWWETEIFSTQPNWSKVNNTQVQSLTAEEQAFLDNQVETLCSMLNEWEINHKYKDLPKEAWDFIKAEGFWAIAMDKKHGGLGFSHAAHSAIVTKVASCSLSAAYTVMVPNSLGPAELIDYCGTDEQKEHYLPRLARGEEIGCFGLTSLYAGSDAASIPDRGVVCRDLFQGQEVLGIRLNFKKRYITLAPVATLIGLAFRLFDPDALLGSQSDVGITMALLPSNTKGVANGRRHSPANIGFMNGPIEGEDVFIPLDWVIGGAQNCGQGWKILMGCLSMGRGISMPALATAAAQQCYTLTGAYAAIREQFKRPVGSFEGVQEALGHIGGMGYLIEANRYGIAQAVNEGARPSVAAAIVKYHLTQLSRRLLELSMDVHSGHALQAGPNNLLAEVYAGIPISTVGEGANLMTRNLIIFGQGIMRAHPYLRQEVLAAVNNDDLNGFDKVLLVHFGFSLGAVVRGACYGLTGARWIKSPKSPLSSYHRRITQLSNAFVLVSDFALALLGKQLKNSEFLSARLGDVCSYLYMALCVLKYSHDHDNSESDLLYARWSLDYCIYQCGESFKQIFNNYPKRWLGKLLQFKLFPWGLNFPYPKDSMSQLIAVSMQDHSDMRARLTRYCYKGARKTGSIGRVLAAFDVYKEAAPLYEKVNRLIKGKMLSRALTWRETIQSAAEQQLISSSECQQLLESERLRDQAIAVDEFAFESLVGFNADQFQHVHMD